MSLKQVVPVINIHETTFYMSATKIKLTLVKLILFYLPQKVL